VGPAGGEREGRGWWNRPGWVGHAGWADWAAREKKGREEERAWAGWGEEREREKERSWAKLSLAGTSKEWERERRRDGSGPLERRDFFFQNWVLHYI
jgi:hypothetical protein